MNEITFFYTLYDVLCDVSLLVHVLVIGLQICAERHRGSDETDEAAVETDEYFIESEPYLHV